MEPGDAVDREDFNADNAAIDAALGALNTAVERKAEQADLAATNAAIADTNTQLAAVAAALGSGGENCRIQYGTYVGTGTYGVNNPTTLQFSMRPLLVHIAEISANNVTIYTVARPAKKMGYLTLTWDDHSVSWYYPADQMNPGTSQMNNYGMNYYYTAIGYDE